MGVWGIVVTAASSWYLAGLSWTVSLVVYPAFARVGPREWQAYHLAHTRAIVPAVGPAWLAEAIGIVMWLSAPPNGTARPLAVCAVAAGATVVLTATLAIPAHAALATNFDRDAWIALQRSQSFRTAAWTIAALAATTALVKRLS